MTDRVITLGDRHLPVQPIPLGTLRKVLPAFNRAGAAMALGQINDAVFDDLLLLLSLATGIKVDELEAMPGSYLQMMQAIDTIADVCGLKPKEGDRPGEARPGTASPA